MKSESRPPGAAPLKGLAIPPEFDDVIACVAWLYYVDGLTQNEIADTLSVSRATIVKLLQDARERGAVTIRINPEAAERTRMSRALSQKYGLAAAYVIPA